MTDFKPAEYNSLSPYLIVDNAQQLVNQLETIFNASILRRYDHGNGKIAHLELKIDDTVIMISDSTEQYSANKTILHVYVPDVMETFEKAMNNGCEMIEAPILKAGDPDKRGSFYDCAGNFWSVSTQIS